MTKKTEETPKNEIAVKTTADLALGGMFDEDAGAGFDNADSSSYSIPFLGILQKMSPQCDADDGAYIEGAKPGLFFNSVSKELLGEQTFLVPVLFERKMVEWKDRNSGGGFVGSYSPNDPIVNTGEQGPGGKLLLPNGNHLMDTRYHYCLLVNPETYRIEPVVISMASTQIKKSKNWMTIMSNLRLRRADGSAFNPPMFSHVYKATTMTESNDQGTWKGWVFGVDRCLGTVPEFEQFDKTVYAEAKTLLEAIRKGEAAAANPDEQVNGTGNGNASAEDRF